MIYDLIIIGAGAAGLTASIYASRYKIDHLIFGDNPGGQGNLAGTVENFPGYLSIRGPTLVKKFVEQAESYGVKVKTEQVVGLNKTGDVFTVETEREKYQARTLILATGATYRRLDIPGEEKLLGRGVSYCTHCDAPLFKDKVVAVVGGGDTAITGALHVASFARKVYLIHRREAFRAEPVWVEKMKANKKIEPVLQNQVKEILGENKVESVTLDQPYQGLKELKVDGVFVEIGQVPSSVLANQLGVELDEQGYVKVTPKTETNVAGVFAAGDIAAIQGGVIFRQFVTSAADGARAAAGVYQFLHQQAPTPSWGS
ncbi:hypothetical protein FJZ40_05370 [Candidatus Shapirobacteria bacterium]|nr:hypothetical protein [Candidatus Shapirobacteria bacterium]